MTETRPLPPLLSSGLRPAVRRVWQPDAGGVPVTQLSAAPPQRLHRRGHAFNEIGREHARIGA